MQPSLDALGRHPFETRPLSLAPRDGLAIARPVRGALLRMRGELGVGRNAPNKKKKDQLPLAQYGIPALGPAPTIPGGWGLRNPKPKEPDQRSVLFSQARAAGDWPKRGGIVILANVPVTRGTREFLSR